jgi:hypothetical protein
MVMNLQDSCSNHHPTTTRGFLRTVNWNLKGALFFLISGTFAPFSQDRIRALYPNHDAYVSAVSLAAKDLMAKRYILQEDADAYIEAAARSAIGL